MSASSKLQQKLAVLAVAAGVLASGCEGRPSFGAAMKDGESLTGPAIVAINLSKGLAEQGASTIFGAVPGTSHADLVQHGDEVLRAFLRCVTGRRPFGQAVAAQVEQHGAEPGLGQRSGERVVEARQVVHHQAVHEHDRGSALFAFWRPEPLHVEAQPSGVNLRHEP